MKLYLFTTISIFLFQSYTQVKEYNFSAVDQIINNSIKDSAFPGAVLLVWKDGAVIHHTAYGHQTYDSNSPNVELNTIYDLASVSKVIATTTAAMICIDRYLINLDDKVTRFIPEFSINNKENITVRHLLLHNSGLPAWKKLYGIFENEEEVLSNIYNSELEYNPGSKTVYSDLGMIILGKCIEKVTGRKLNEFCRDEIFKPLSMENTFYNPPDDVKNRIAPTEEDNYWRNRLIIGEVHDESAAMLGGFAGHAGLFSTAEDLSKVLQMILQKGSYNGKQYIRQETVEMFIRKQSALSTRALGWDTKSPKGSSAGYLFSPLSYGHTGFTGTSVWTDPSRNLFVILLTNRVHPTRNNNKILKVRPRVHDAVIKAVENLP